MTMSNQAHLRSRLAHIIGLACVALVLAAPVQAQQPRAPEPATSVRRSIETIVFPQEPTTFRQIVARPPVYARHHRPPGVRGVIVALAVVGGLLGGGYI